MTSLDLLTAGATPAGGRGHARKAGAFWPAWLRALAREPLVHFLVLGAALFLAWPLVSGVVSPPSNQIVIGAGQMRRAVEIFSKTHARPPNEQELAQLVEQEIQTEVEFREGLALGLDRDDEIIRRRIAQKLRFMVQDVVDQATPSDAELQRFLDAHAADFGAEPRFAFSQIYLNPDRHGASLDADATRLMARLNAPDGRLNYGVDSDVLPVPNDFEAIPLHNIASMFGDDFAASLADLPAGRWAGPIRSGYGVHLVLLREKRPGEPPLLANVRPALLREWQSARRVEANAQAYTRMRAKYVVRVEWPLDRNAGLTKP